MDIISYSKASKTIKNAKTYDTGTIGAGAEGRFESVDARIDFLEEQIKGRFVDIDIFQDTKKGTTTGFVNNDGKLTVKKIESIEDYNKLTQAEKSIYLGKYSSDIEHPNNYTVTKQSAHYSSYSAEQVFGNGSGWDGNGPVPLYFIFKAPSKIRVKKISFINGLPYGNEYIKSFTFYGSNDPNSFNTLGTFSNFATNGQVEFEINNDIEYQYYWFNVTSSNSTSYASVKGLRLYDQNNNFNHLMPSATWLSPVIDMSSPWVVTDKIISYFNEVNLGTTTYTKEIGYSDDGVNFTYSNITHKPDIITTVPAVMEPDENGDLVEVAPSYTYATPTTEIQIQQHRYMRLRLNVTINDDEDVPEFDWNVEFTGRKYGVQKYMKEIERINTINFAKLEFKTDSYMKAQKNEMYNMVVDVLENDTLQTLSAPNTSLEWVLKDSTSTKLDDFNLSTYTIEKKNVLDVLDKLQEGQTQTANEKVYYLLKDNKGLKTCSNNELNVLSEVTLTKELFLESGFASLYSIPASYFNDDRYKKTQILRLSDSDAERTMEVRTVNTLYAANELGYKGAGKVIIDFSNVPLASENLSVHIKGTISSIELCRKTNINFKEIISVEKENDTYDFEIDLKENQFFKNQTVNNLAAIVTLNPGDIIEAYAFSWA